MNQKQHSSIVTPNIAGRSEQRGIPVHFKPGTQSDRDWSTRTKHTAQSSEDRPDLALTPDHSPVDAHPAHTTELHLVFYLCCI